MHHLKDLFISFWSDKATDVDYCLSQMQLPAIPNNMLPVLRCLHTHSFCLSSFAVELLLSINVSSTLVHKDPTRNEIAALPPVYDALDRCPNLEVLRMGTITSVPIEAPYAPRTVHLPRLRALSIWDSHHPDRVQKIMRALRIPSTALVDLDGSNWPSTTLAAALHSHPRASDRVHIRFDSKNVGFGLPRQPSFHLMCYAGDKMHLQVVVSDLDTLPVAGLLVSPGVATLECVFVPKGREEPFPPLDWPALLSSAAGVTRLALCGFPVHPPFEALGGDPDEGYAAPMLCPVLEEVTYRWEACQTSQGEMYSDDTGGPVLAHPQDVIEAITSHLAWRAERGGQRLKRLVLDRRFTNQALHRRRRAAHFGAFAGENAVPEAVVDGDMLAPLRMLVDGSVKYKESTGYMGYL